MTETEKYQKAYDQAIKYLTIKFRTVGEIQEKLKLKKYPTDVIMLVLRELERLDFLNDERYAKIFVENLKNYKSFGFYGIKAKLMAKKIPTDMLEEVLDEFFPVEEEIVVARRFVKKLSRAGREEYGKVARSLSSKGFRTEVVAKVLRELPK
jgi:regulatory protein